MKITHIITDLDVGGAERMLDRLLNHSSYSKNQIQIISLKNKGYLHDSLLAEGYNVSGMGFRAGSFSISGFYDLKKRIKDFGPNVIQTWMYHADFLGGLAAKSLGIPVIWNIRQTTLKKGIHKNSTRHLAKICAYLSSNIPVKIVTCAHSAVDWHTKLGYDASKFIVIPNGVDTDEFKLKTSDRSRIREEFGLNEDDIIVGTAARFSLSKGYDVLIKAIENIVSSSENIKFIFCGNNIEPQNEQLWGWIIKQNLKDKISLLGTRSDMPAIYSAMDILVSPSLAEGLSNTIIEAMSCSLPCVVTDVGDSALIVRDTGLIIPPGDVGAITKSILELAQDKAQRKKLGREARKKILNEYSIQEIVRQYEDVYKKILIPE